MAPQGLQYAQNVREQFAGSVKGTGWPGKFFTFSLAIFAILFTVYLGLSFGYKVFLDKSIENIEKELGSLSNKITDQQKEDLITLYSQVTNIGDLIREHSLTSQVFPLLEANTAQKVKYIGFEVVVPDREVSVEGFAATYEDLVRELTLLEESPQIEKYSLEESAIEKGIVKFKVKFILSEDILFPST